jgi:hypothetical protein
MVNKQDLATLEAILDDISPGISASVMPVARAAPSVINTVDETPRILIQQTGGIVIMDDKSQNIEKVENVGSIAAGDARISGGSFQGSGVQLITSNGQKIDLSELAKELSALRAALREQATELDHDIALASVAEAEKAAVEGDEAATVSALRKAGRWALDVAKQIGASLATEALKSALLG